MHRLIVPKYSSAHRFACLALYRALLRRCNNLERTAPHIDSAQLHIRERFRKYKNLQSPSQTANALKAGYEAFDLLHSAYQGNENDASLINKIIADTKLVKQQKRETQALLSSQRPAKPLSKKQIQAEENRQYQNSTDQPHPERQNIFARPQRNISGKRHVPSLVNAGGIPILRIKKPQPRNLSRMIRSKINQRTKWSELSSRLDVQVLFCKDEDSWDHLTGTWDSDESWVWETRAALRATKDQISDWNSEKKARAEALWKIVLAERKLAETERGKSANS